jgi:hypothetical protein
MLSPAFAFLQRGVSINGNISPFFGAPVRPFNTDLVDDCGRVTEADKHSRIVGGRVAAIGADATPERESVRANNTHARANDVATLASQHSQADPMSGVADVVDQQPDRSVVICRYDIGVTIVVYVAERSAATDVRSAQGCSRPFGDVREVTVTKIAKQLLGLLQREFFVAGERLGRMPDRSIDGQNVQPAVVVEIEPGRAEACIWQA